MSDVFLHGGCSFIKIGHEVLKCAAKVVRGEPKPTGDSHLKLVPLPLS